MLSTAMKVPDFKCVDVLPVQHYVGCQRVARIGVALLLLAALAHADRNVCHAQATAGDPKQPVAALLQQGIDLAASGKLAEAEVPLEQARTLAPEDAAVLTALGKVKARMKEVGPAVAIFREVTVAHPRSAEAHLNLALALADTQNLPDALSEVSKAVQLAPNSAEAHLNRARVLADLHRQADAEAEFVKAAALSPSNPDCFFYWALLEREKSNYEKESSLLQSLVKLQPRNDEAWLLLGDSFSYQSKKQEAIASWRQALAINPHSRQAVYKLSRALRPTNPEEAKKLESDFAALRQNSESLDDVKKLGNEAYVAMQSQNWTVAITTFKQAIALCGDCEVLGTLHKDLGLAFCDSGQFTEGRKELELALQLTPGDPDVVKALTVLDHQTTAHP